MLSSDAWTGLRICLKITDNFRLITPRKYTGNRLLAVFSGSENPDFEPAGDHFWTLNYFLITFGNNAI